MLLDTRYVFLNLIVLLIFYIQRSTLIMILIVTTRFQSCNPIENFWLISREFSTIYVELFSDLSACNDSPIFNILIRHVDAFCHPENICFFDGLCTILNYAADFRGDGPA